MGMKVTAKVRFNASRESFEKFGNGMYLIYLPCPEDGDTIKVLQDFISRNLGVPASRVEYAGQDVRKNWIFEMM